MQHATLVSMNIKTKSQAIELFRTATALAKALGITKSAVGQWPEELTNRQINEITGAALNMGLLSRRRKSA